MDLNAVATLQGPAARGTTILLGALGVGGPLAIALVRTVRLGEVDNFSLGLIAFAIVWAAGVASLDIFANRALASAARRQPGHGKTETILFRVGQVLDPTMHTAQTVSKGWITLAEDQLVVTMFRGRSVLLRLHRNGLRAVDSSESQLSYAVLTFVFADGASFQCIPVETGLRNMGLGSARGAQLAARARAWMSESVRNA